MFIWIDGELYVALLLNCLLSCYRSPCTLESEISSTTLLEPIQSVSTALSRLIAVRLLHCGMMVSYEFRVTRHQNIRQRECGPDHRRRSDWNSGGRMAGLTIKVLL